MQSDIRLDDLKGRVGSRSKLMNVRIPAHVSDAIDAVASSLGAAKTEVVIALLNEGLDRAADLLRGWQPVRVALPPPARVCTVEGCGRAYVARGFCASHYQSYRRSRR